MIPDMQREYCWAKTFSGLNSKSLVHNFTLDLIANAEKTETVQMGLLYAYESPRNQIQLCDGQQRITTLFLLLGYLYKATDSTYLKNEIEKALVLPRRNNGVLECRLRYAIRESTLFFTRDLTENIFLNSWDESQNIKSCIKNQDWYFNEYDLDPSIQNMLDALSVFQVLDNVLDEKVALHILKNINFLFFDMENRTYGEEQFVVLNTTGKPLTITENIKPKILGGLDDNESFKAGKSALRYHSDMWEEWEYYFWNNKNVFHKTSDKGLNEFFRWIYIIENSNADQKLGSDSESYTLGQKALVENTYDILELKDDKLDLLELIHEYFQAIKEIQKDFDIKKRFLFQPKALSQIQIFEFLPLLAYLKNFNTEITSQGYIRLKNFLHSRAKDNNISKASSVTAIRSIQIVLKLSKEEEIDIANYRVYEEQASETILNELEKFKFDVITSHNSRDEVEKNFWEAECYEVCDGNIEFIFSAIDPQLKKNYLEFNLEEFTSMKNLVKMTFNEPSDLMRRGLLTFGHYYLHDGNTPTLNSNRFCLGNSAAFYGKIANGNNLEESQILTDFLNVLNKSMVEVTVGEINRVLKDFIQNYEGEKNDIWERTRFEFIKNKDLMKYMTNKMFCISYDEQKSFILKKQKATSVGNYQELMSLEKLAELKV